MKKTLFLALFLVGCGNAGSASDPESTEMPNNVSVEASHTPAPWPDYALSAFMNGCIPDYAHSAGKSVLFWERYCLCMYEKMSTKYEFEFCDTHPSTCSEGILPYGRGCYDKADREI